MFTDEDGIRMKKLFSLRDERGLNPTEQKELEELIARWEKAYFKNVKTTAASDINLMPIVLLSMVNIERRRGREKWGEVDTNPNILLNAAVEELGEVAHAINHQEGVGIVIQEIAETIGVLSRLYDMYMTL